MLDARDMCMSASSRTSTHVPSAHDLWTNVHKSAQARTTRNTLTEPSACCLRANNLLLTCRPAAPPLSRKPRALAAAWRLPPRIGHPPTVTRQLMARQVGASPCRAGGQTLHDREHVTCRSGVCLCFRLIVTPGNSSMRCIVFRAYAMMLLCGCTVALIGRLHCAFLSR